MKCIVRMCKLLIYWLRQLKEAQRGDLPKVMQLLSGGSQHKLDKWNIHHGVTQISISQNVAVSPLRIRSLSSVH